MTGSAGMNELPHQVNALSPVAAAFSFFLPQDR